MGYAVGECLGAEKLVYVAKSLAKTSSNTKSNRNIR